MKIIVFDTETTGLPKSHQSSIYKIDEWPYIVQLAWVIYDTDTKKINTHSHIIKCPCESTPESLEIHKIDKHRIDEEGIDIKHVLKLFTQSVKKCDIIVGHNISFDKRMVMVECIRNNHQPIFDKINEYCTMQNGKTITNILTKTKSGREYFKFPKLTELHENLFQTIPNGIHDALIDTMICLRCYIFIVYKYDIFTQSKQFSELYNTHIQVNV